MSKAARDKGRRGQREARNLLTGRDWSCAELNAGTAVEDLIAVDPTGQSWSVEIKNTVSIMVAHRKQAIAQATARRLPWMLLSKIGGTDSWLIQRKGMRPVVWSENDQPKDDML